VPHKDRNEEPCGKAAGYAVYGLLVAICCFLGACASSADFDMLRQDVGRLQSDSLSMRNDLEGLKEKTTGVAKEESFNAVRMSQSEIQSQLSNVSKDLQTLNGRFDENKYFIEKTLKDSSAETDAIKAQVASIEGQLKEMRDRLNALEGRLKQQEPIKDQEKGTEMKPDETHAETHIREDASKATSKTDKLSRYEAAYNAFKNKKYKDARDKFESFIKEFPNDELAENANFWIAETFYGEKDFESAILAYESFLKKYPNSKKAPSALLKQGLSFMDIGDRKTGKVILGQLIERYPKSKEAELAKKAIEEPGRKNVKKKK
jgi:tol-pal system protein YbgF